MRRVVSRCGAWPSRGSIVVTIYVVNRYITYKLNLKNTAYDLWLRVPLVVLAPIHGPEALAGVFVHGHAVIQLASEQHG